MARLRQLRPGFASPHRVEPEFYGQIEQFVVLVEQYAQRPVSAPKVEGQTKADSQT